MPKVEKCSLKGKANLTERNVSGGKEIVLQVLLSRLLSKEFIVLSSQLQLGPQVFNTFRKEIQRD